MTTAASSASLMHDSGSADLRRAGGGALVAALAVLLIPLWVFVPSLVGHQWPSGVARFDPVSNASWWVNLITGVLALAETTGVAFLVVGVRRALPHGFARDLAGVAGTVWTTSLVLYAAGLFVALTPAQSATWASLSASAEIRSMIGAASTVVQWGFGAAQVLAGLAWLIAFVVAGGGAGIAPRGSIITGLIVAGIAGALVLFGVVPPAITFAQIVLLTILGFSLLRRARVLRD